MRYRFISFCLTLKDFVMKKKFRCLVCGYVYEGENPPAECPQCHAPASKFVEIKDEGGKPQWACEHHIGDGRVEDKEVVQGLKDHFNGECTEVGMYLAMSRQAEREGYPEIAEAFKGTLSKRRSTHPSSPSFSET